MTPPPIDWDQITLSALRIGTAANIPSFDLPDFAQIVCLDVRDSLGAFDPEQGTPFDHWVDAIARRHVQNYLGAWNRRREQLRGACSAEEQGTQQSDLVSVSTVPEDAGPAGRPNEQGNGIVAETSPDGEGERCRTAVSDWVRRQWSDTDVCAALRDVRERGGRPLSDFLHDIEKAARGQ